MDKRRDGAVKIQDTEMYYVSFGKGKKNMVVLPGLSDGLATVKGKGMILSECDRVPGTLSHSLYVQPEKCDRVHGTLSHLCKTCEIWYNRDADAVASSLIF